MAEHKFHFRLFALDAKMLPPANMQHRIKSVLTERKIGVFVVAILVANVLFAFFERCCNWSILGLVAFYNSHRSYDSFRIDPFDYVSPLETQPWHAAYFMIKCTLLSVAAALVHISVGRKKSVRGRKTMNKLRTAMADNYIGAIAVAYLIADGIQSLVGALMYPLQGLLVGRPSGPLMPSTQFRIDPVVIGLGVFRSAISFIVAYLLIRWLYLNSEVRPASQDSSEQLAD